MASRIRFLKVVEPDEDGRRLRLVEIAVRTAVKISSPYACLDRDGTIRTLRMWERHGLTDRERAIVVQEFGRLNG